MRNIREATAEISYMYRSTLILECYDQKPMSPVNYKDSNLLCLEVRSMRNYVHSKRSLRATGPNLRKVYRQFQIVIQTLTAAG